ncbi:baseplate J/gp47 family protein [Pseudomonas sp. 15A4]|uniref:baseplate J/gp47 family protein n=1 Tax=Pseudomonas sp. 15A4 TaxID=2804761 RepID=UPI001967A12E|nr:baseplate J/gp47 family protein [Pseudomonas sp. 15A4]QSB20615.1 baseplate J/gp47 family protein [Pseudomonas sp. 15A4]
MSDVDFKAVMANAGIPTTEAGLKAAWEKEVAAEGAKVANTSSYSPFWRVITALVTQPVLWLLDYLCVSILPNFFVKTAVDAWLDMLAWAVNVERKGATRAVGAVLFTRAAAEGVLELDAGIVIQSPAINGNVYKLITTANASFLDGQLQAEVPVQAVEPGSGYNLAPGYYAILPVPIAGIVQVANADGWLHSPGADPEPNDQLRLRVRNQFSAVNQWHTDAVYRAMISAFPGVRPDGVYFEHGAPRGPGSANAFVLFDAGVPAETYLVQINEHIRDLGNHGHGDDLLAFLMPEVQVTFEVQVWPDPHLDKEGVEGLIGEIELYVRAAFRESTPRDYQPTLTYPQSRFSFSRLMEELHGQFPQIQSLHIDSPDIISGLDIPGSKA